MDPAQLQQEIERVRTQGYASSESEFVVGVVGAAAPVYGPANKPVACLSISVPSARKALTDLAEMIPLMQNASKRITRILSTSQTEGE